jgi:hypothetical protein
MGTSILAAYGLGAGITAFTLLLPREFKQDKWMNAGMILIWPVYWIYFLSVLINNRRHP